MKNTKGFTLIELLVTMTIFSLLIGIITLNLNTAQHKASISSTVETLLTDLSQQQIKAMVGDTEGRTLLDNYGIYVGGTSYTLFHGTHSASEPTNFTITLPSVQQITTTFSSNQVVFQKGSGNILNFSASQNSITVRDTVSGEQKVIQLNRYGIITSVQ